MNSFKIVLKTLGAVFAIFSALYAIGKIDQERRDLEFKLANCRRKNRVLNRAYDHALSHLTREEQRHVNEDAHEDYKFEMLIKDLKK